MQAFFDTLHIDHNKCPDGCSLCEQACANGRGGGRSASGRIKAVHTAEMAFHGAVTCVQCADPACVASCPTGAISKSAGDGTVRITESKCVGCSLCTLACAYSGVYFDTERHKAFKCDRCDGEPQCVDACPYGILSFVKTSSLQAHLIAPDVFAQGTGLCFGCPAELALRVTGRIVGHDTIMFGAPGCASMPLIGMGEKASCQLAVTTCLMTNVPSTMTGVKRYYQKMGKHVNVVAFVGDGTTVDIGFQPLSGAAERGENIVYICYDNEGYMNTGIQRSGSTPFKAWTNTSPVGSLRRGKGEEPKNVPLLMAFHKIPYAATATIGFMEDYAQKLEKALAVRDGLAYIHLLSPCPTGWRASTDSSIQISRKAVETNFFPLWEAERGRFRLTYRVTNRRPVQEFARLTGRYSHLAEEELEDLQRVTDERYELIESLTALRRKAIEAG